MSTMQPTTADFAALRSRLDRIPTPAARAASAPARPPAPGSAFGTAMPPNVAALVAAELDRRERHQRQAEHAATLARLRGGPCVYCGQTVSGVWQDFAGEHGTAAVRRELLAHWTAVPGGVACFECSQDTWACGGAHTHKGHVARALLASVDRAGNWTAAALGDLLRQTRTPVYWVEHVPRPAIRTTEAPLCERFAFVDVATILDALPKPPAPPTFHKGRPCPHCQTADRWVHVPASTTYLRTDASSPATAAPPADLSTDLLAPLRAIDITPGLAEVPTAEAWRCWACGNYGGRP